MNSYNIDSMRKNIGILLLLIAGISYSAYLSLEGGLFIGFVFTLITIGIASTLYMLEKSIDYRIIIYIWIAIVALVVVSFISIGVFRMAEIFRSPLKYI
ncbi:hypothetical protein A3K64_00630 [Candidatus Micrarchaeota archaeon RBG_16_36_9]|nr:MAG: hypothetical protein A3K64_00630 [Candidatus Micrarchaeota archaeon RBG_16_36_9]